MAASGGRSSSAFRLLGDVAPSRGGNWGEAQKRGARGARLLPQLRDLGVVLFEARAHGVLRPGARIGEQLVRGLNKQSLPSPLHPQQVLSREARGAERGVCRRRPAP